MPNSGEMPFHVDGPAESLKTYEIVRTPEGWVILHDGRAEGALDTQMAAFDSVVAAAMTDILSGRGVVIKAESNSEQRKTPRG